MKNWKTALVVMFIFAVSSILTPGLVSKAMAEDDNKKGGAAVVGAEAGAATSTGISTGTIAIGAVILGGIAIGALAAGGGGGSSTTAHH